MIALVENCRKLGVLELANAWVGREAFETIVQMLNDGICSS
jgi:hypothetical protein